MPYSSPPSNLTVDVKVQDGLQTWRRASVSAANATSFFFIRSLEASILILPTDAEIEAQQLSPSSPIHSLNEVRFLDL
jgi:hypothetical protein